jgi:putative hydrolase of the HAD superfamily
MPDNAPGRLRLKDRLSEEGGLLRKPLQGLIFDFDGLIVDTETARYYAWKEVIEAHGVELPLSFWQENIGLPREAFDPLELLERKAGKPVDREAVQRRKQAIFESRMGNESLRPGVREYIEEGQRRELKLAICSSSPRKWVVSNLARYGIDGVFDAMVTGSEASAIKPHPELYLRVLDMLSLPAKWCIAFEDSPKGVQSARAAGIFCVAVANSITAKTDLSAADVQLSSLAEMPLGELEKRFSRAVRK